MVDTMITLHESTETSFTTNGLGTLSDAITCEVTEERNGEFELEIEYPVTGIRYKELQLRRIIMAKPNPYSDPQPFRIYAITKPINGIVTINAEHISYDMSGYPVSAFAADTVQNAFINMKSASAVDCPFSFSTDKTTTANMTVLKPSSMRSLLGGVDGSILDVYGGEYEFDKFNVKLWNKRGADRGVSIRYGKNLTDLKQEENCSSVYTGVYPFWYSEQEGLVQLDEKIVKAYGKVLIRLDRDGITLSEDVQISYENISDAPSIPTKVSELTNDSKYTTMPDVEKKGYQTKANVTKITKDTVTTTYVNALDITAKQVNCKSGSKEANINAGASHYKYSNEYIGEIGTNSWTGNDNRRGLVFDLDENGDYMTWAAQPKSGQSYLVKLLYERNGYTSNTVTYNADTINLGCDVDMHYYKLKNVSWENGSGITGTMRFVQVGGMNSDGTASNWSNNAYLQFERGVLVKAGWYDY